MQMVKLSLCLIRHHAVKTQMRQKADASFLGKNLLVPTTQFLCPRDNQHMLAKIKTPATQSLD